MIKVTVYRNSIHISGHAGYASPGKDIVCAAVSILTQNLIQSIQDLTEDDMKYELCGGDTEIRYQNASERSRVLIDSFCIGIAMIADTYPKYVQMIDLKQNIYSGGCTE